MSMQNGRGNPEQELDAWELLKADFSRKLPLQTYRGMLVITKEDASLALAREQVRILESLPGHRSLP